MKAQSTIDNIFLVENLGIFQPAILDYRMVYICPGWWFQIFFMFTPKIGEMIQFDEQIFEMGLFNHHAVSICTIFFSEDDSTKVWK